VIDKSEKMNYTILLFDLDDTLLDFCANESDSLKKLFAQYGYDFSNELFSVYNSVNKQLWADYENGNISLDNVLNTRFFLTMLRLGKVVDGVEWEKKYRELLGNGCQLIDGALKIIKDLSLTHRLFIITNGINLTQIKRLKQSGLYDFFEAVFDSESIGHQKPSKEFFDYVMSHIKDFEIKEALVIGDSYKTDMIGGIQAGIDTCWINRNGQEIINEYKSTYTIKSLLGLYDILQF
jgi:2-haloacid dehalogenase